MALRIVANAQCLENFVELDPFEDRLTASHFLATFRAELGIHLPGPEDEGSPLRPSAFLCSFWCSDFLRPILGDGQHLQRVGERAGVM